MTDIVKLANVQHEGLRILKLDAIMALSGAQKTDIDLSMTEQLLREYSWSTVFDRIEMAYFRSSMVP